MFWETKSTKLMRKYEHTYVVETNEELDVFDAAKVEEPSEIGFIDCANLAISTSVLFL